MADKHGDEIGSHIDSQIAINYQQITKSYGKQQVLKGVSLQVKKGEFLGLVGANGAGKTTMIKSLLDFIAPDSGSIHIAQKDNKDPLAREQLAFLPERFNPPYFFKGKDFLKFTGKIHGIEFDQQIVSSLCNNLDLAEDALKKPVKSYSKGMAQKLGLMGCFLAQKPVIILDEPMSGLDPKARAFLKKQIRSLKESNTTLFFSTHMLADVDAICDRMAILDQGVIKFIGTTDECRERFGSDDLEQAYLNCITSVTDNR